MIGEFGTCTQVWTKELSEDPSDTTNGEILNSPKNIENKTGQKIVKRNVDGSKLFANCKAKNSSRNK